MEGGGRKEGVGRQAGSQMKTTSCPHRDISKTSAAEAVHVTTVPRDAGLSWDSSCRRRG